ncbi:MAG: class I SAM-dependent methyltransferase [Cyclobacteriaceae bacterium]
MKSPLTGTSDTQLVKEIEKSYIIDGYKRAFKIDVDDELKDIDRVQLWVCNQTGLKFYTPKAAAGGENLYKALRKNSWYYKPWKWEHDFALGQVKEKSEVLEVGCAEGSFLEKCVEQKKCNVTGLELNSDAVDIARTKNLNVVLEDIMTFDTTQYDYVLMFQVLEHIDNLKPFFQKLISLTKKGGRIVISVPNNDSFIKKTDETNFLNMPPHHMLLWRKKSLVNLAKMFGLTVEKIAYEPLQLEHLDWFIDSFKIHGNGIWGRIFRYKIRPIVKRILERMNFLVKGHTILIVLQK